MFQKVNAREQYFAVTHGQLELFQISITQIQKCLPVDLFPYHQETRRGVRKDATKQYDAASTRMHVWCSRWQYVQTHSFTDAFIYTRQDTYTHNGERGRTRGLVPRTGSLSGFLIYTERICEHEIH